LLKKKKIQISMDGKGRAKDNIWIERFWRTIKQEYVYLNPCNDGLELYKGIREYMEYYNYNRAHQGIKRKIPAVVYGKVA
jgi:putative transposase